MIIKCGAAPTCNFEHGEKYSVARLGSGIIKVYIATIEPFIFMFYNIYCHQYDCDYNQPIHCHENTFH